MKPNKKKNNPPVQAKAPAKATQKGKAGYDALNYLPIFLLVVSVLFVVFCRLRLLDVPLERDEGEYAYVSQQLLKGIPPFVSIYHFKLPGIYGLYALIISIFGQTQEGIHMGLMFVNLLTCAALYLIVKKVFGAVTAAYTASVFFVISLSQSLQGFSANAEHFVLMPAMTGILLMLYAIDYLSASNKVKAILVFFLSGLVMGISYLMKQHGMFFIAFAGAFFLYKIFISKPVNWKNLFLGGISFGVGALIPLGAVCLIFLKLGLFDKFWWWTWYYPRIYVTGTPFSIGMEFLKATTFSSRPNGVAILNFLWPAVLLAVWGMVSVFFQRSFEKKFFVTGLLIVTIPAVAIGFSFYPHYFQLATPVVALMAGLGAESLLFLWKGKTQIADAIYPGFCALLVALGICIYTERSYLFEMDGNHVSNTTYQANPFPEAVEVGKYIEQHSKPTDKIAIFGSEPEIYFYAHRKSATGFVYVYEMFKSHQFAHHFQEQMISEIDSAKPKFIVIVNVSASWFASSVEHMDTLLSKWGETYTNLHYAPAAHIDLLWPQPDKYCWDEANQGPCMPISNEYIEIMERKKD